MLTTLAIVFVFGSMVMIHEFGHYIVAKWIGVKVIEFSFGFGPKIVGYQGKETLYALRVVPLGGSSNFMVWMQKSMKKVKRL